MYNQMPSIEKSTKWFVRITAPHSVLREVDFVWPDLVRCLGVLHVGSETSKEHAHFLIELSSCIQHQSISVRCKKLFSCMKAFTGNAHIAVKPWDGDPRAAQYLYAARSKPETFIREGFTQEEIDTYVSAAATVDESWVNMSPRSSSQRKGGPTVWDLAVCLAARMKLYSDLEESGFRSLEEYYEQVALDAISVHKEHSKSFCTYSIQKVIDTAMGIVGGSHRGKLVGRIVSKYCPRMYS